MQVIPKTSDTNEKSNGRYQIDGKREELNVVIIVAFTQYEHGTNRNYVKSRTVRSANEMAKRLAMRPEIEEVLVGNLRQVK
jgi:hypothetical protein